MDGYGRLASYNTTVEPEPGNRIQAAPGQSSFDPQCHISKTTYHPLPAHCYPGPYHLHSIPSSSTDASPILQRIACKSLKRWRHSDRLLSMWNSCTTSCSECIVLFHYLRYIGCCNISSIRRPFEFLKL